ncbi:hypothetical protein GWK08_10725 [Leptobacterium flavescens]|uniref:Beta-carotene 15,15'-monooxygenase n=1 Tax=Leptobacterium flavescens TaxID=472055 RepID=A0A6P0UU16_9FLAO|nr:hypothetical protein [Leptobacterium flavescens]NER13916.1 hypothetical protein [Leptobacterium flavescens]
MKNKERIDRILQNGYELDFGDVFNKSFEVYKKSIWMILLGILVVGMITAVLVILLFSVIFGIQLNDFISLDPAVSTIGGSVSYFLSTTLFGIVIAALLGPVNAGFLKVCKDAKDNKEPSFSSIFQYYSSEYLGNIIVATVILSIVSGVFSFISQFMLSMLFLNYIFSIIFSTLTVLIIPLIIFKDFNAMQAIEYSIKLVSKNFLMVFLLILVGTLASFLGVFLCGIGILFSLPFLYAVYFCTYDAIVGDDESSEIDEIGTGEVY